MVPLLLLLVLLPLSLVLSETQYQSSQAGMKSRLLNKSREVSRAQNQIQNSSERRMLFLSLLCCLVSIIILPLFAESLTERSFSLLEVPQLINVDGSAILLLGLILSLHVAGEICLATGERRYHNRYAGLCLNSFFWLPLLFAWTAIAYYLPLDNSRTTTNAVSSLWLALLQPLGSLVMILSLLGPFLLVSTTVSSNKSLVYNWIRELRMLISLLVITLTIVGSRTCFSPMEVQNTAGEILRLVALPVVFLVLLLLVKRLKHNFYARGGFVAEAFWKRTQWLALIALTASFLAFHILGMSDPWMHVLLNFSLLAIWGGFIVPKYLSKPATSVRNHS